MWCWQLRVHTGLLSCREPPGAAGDGAFRRDAKPHLVRLTLPKCIQPRVNALPLPGRIKAIQLEYSEARRTMTNALRKAPQHTAVGFKQTVSRNLPCSHGAYVPWGSCPWACSGLGAQGLFPCKVHKLLIVVELLLGEIPDRLQFRQPSLKRSLMPYFLLTQGTVLLRVLLPQSLGTECPTSRKVLWGGGCCWGFLSPVRVLPICCTAQQFLKGRLLLSS